MSGEEIQDRPSYEDLLAENAQLRAALQPFSNASVPLDVRKDEDGSFFWGGGEQRQRITVWMGPTDFGRAAEVLPPEQD